MQQRLILTWYLVAIFAASALLAPICRAERRVVVVRTNVHHPPVRAQPDYVVELEPHLDLQWGVVPPPTDVGVGAGFRASIPLFAPPLPHVDNNLALSFGMDVSYLGLCRADLRDCSGSAFWFPVVMQWNFFLMRWWSVFPEIGVAIHHSSWSGGPGRPADCGPRGPGDCAFADSFTRVAFAAWLGTRFSLSDSFSFVLRLGFPSVVAGVSFRL
jgi:hypothetical protein